MNRKFLSKVKVRERHHSWHKAGQGLRDRQACHLKLSSLVLQQPQAVQQRAVQLEVADHVTAPEAMLAGAKLGSRLGEQLLVPLSRVGMTKNSA
jgi:hypothetical protein